MCTPCTLVHPHRAAQPFRPHALQAVAALPACPRLRRLELHSYKLPVDLLPALAALSGLTRLVVGCHKACGPGDVEAAPRWGVASGAPEGLPTCPTYCVMS